MCLEGQKDFSPVKTPSQPLFLETDVKIRLMENFRAIFYAPYYAAHRLGFYANEGVDVELVSSDAPGDAIAHLTNGTIDLTWGGPMRVMTAHDRDDQSPLVCFGEVVSRDPFFLIGNFKRFKLSDLAHLRFAAVSEVPTPWMCLQHDLREADINPAMIAKTSDRTMPDNYASLREGRLDVMQAFEPFASRAEMDRAGEILYAASSRGPTVYTAFIATRSKVAVHRDAFVAMTHALAKMEQWLYAHSGKELAEVVASFFSHVQQELLVRSLQRYLDAGLWARDPAMSKQGFERLGSSFLSGGSLKRPPVFEHCVDARLA
ncbi:NitT/TauT family transport system substrate-binding protein [Bradyrhizobium erythrophlei]|uniref:NitT/TauT family transport system substrate-binding protein n=1 Tax=Bradyrhizobium erythrophlei TaxID=1437360 RepID=A0A1M5WEI2_9BRAD|nr:NitT/TauT family transport system substrate-binding protein [Bradyrhizobium erythrophlei]